MERGEGKIGEKRRVSITELDKVLVTSDTSEIAVYVGGCCGDGSRVDRIILDVYIKKIF